MKKWKKEIQNSFCRKKGKIWNEKSLAVLLIFCGLMGTGRFSLCAEAAQSEGMEKKAVQTEMAQADVETQDGETPAAPEAFGQGIVLEAEKRVEMKASPEETAETLMTFQAGDLIFAVEETAEDWYHVIYQEKEGYIEKDGLTVLELDIEGLNAEMAVNEAETKFVVETVEKYRADARRSKIWGTVIIVLVAGIFGVGIFSAVRSNRGEDDGKNGGKNDDEKNDGEKNDRGRHGSVKEKKRKQIEIEDLN
ncbi:MAG: hypothetical protein K2N80_08915 [Lachnospiraceae bacterium]|nr:hypothetical protein [Lachnospiraceae bacterium]